AEDGIRDLIVTGVQTCALPIFLATLLGVPLPDLGAGSRRGDERKPVPTRTATLGLRGEDLDDLAVLQLPLEGDQLAVEPRANATVTDLGVHRIGEFDRGGAGG